MIGWACKQVLIWSLVIGTGFYAVSQRHAWFPRAGDNTTPIERPGPIPRKPDAVSRTLVLPADRHGHFWIGGRVNHADVRFIVDTGATGIALSREDAARAGIHLHERDFSLETRTANGIARAAPVEIRTLEVGPITVRGIRAHVVEGPMTGMALLGMDFLRRLDSFEVRGDRLTLRW